MKCLYPIILINKIYLTVGANSDVYPADRPLVTVQQANIDGGNVTTVASGIRSSIGLVFHPIARDFYVTCNERSGLGDDLVSDYFTHIQHDDFLGWPYPYLTSNLTEPRRRLLNGTSERPVLVTRTKIPDILFHARSATLDLQFYTGRQCPDRYKTAAFRGSEERDVVFIPFDSAMNRSTGYYEDFVTGSLTDADETKVFGRLVGLVAL